MTTTITTVKYRAECWMLQIYNIWIQRETKMCVGLQVWRDRSRGCAVQQGDWGQLLQLRQDRSPGQRMHHWSVCVTSFLCRPSFPDWWLFLFSESSSLAKGWQAEAFPRPVSSFEFCFSVMKIRGKKKKIILRLKWNVYLGRGVMYDALRNPFPCHWWKDPLLGHAGNLWAHGSEP